MKSAKELYECARRNGFEPFRPFEQLRTGTPKSLRRAVYLYWENPLRKDWADSVLDWMDEHGYPPEREEKVVNMFRCYLDYFERRKKYIEGLKEFCNLHRS